MIYLSLRDKDNSIRAQWSLLLIAQLLYPMIQLWLQVAIAIKVGKLGTKPNNSTFNPLYMVTANQKASYGFWNGCITSVDNEVFWWEFVQKKKKKRYTIRQIYSHIMFHWSLCEPSCLSMGLDPKCFHAWLIVNIRQEPAH